MLPGVSIGDDAVVGIGSIVTKDIPSRTLAVGVTSKGDPQTLISPPGAESRSHSNVC